MAAKPLKIDSLDLDLKNPRIVGATDQRDAMQKILKEQGAKLVNLAETISAHGLSPIDRFLIIRSDKPTKFTVLEGNRRLLALKLLKNAQLVEDLQMSDAFRRRLRAAAASFKATKVEPLDCFEVADREEGVEWIIRRHTGENAGRGIVPWSGLAAARFRGRDPGLQALDFVLEHGALSDDLREQIESRFPISTLERLLATPSVRAAIGFEINDNKLETELPADEALKPLKRIVLDLATEVINVTNVKSRAQQDLYISKLQSPDKADLSRKSGRLTHVDGMTEKDFTPAAPAPAKKARVPKSGSRTTVVPKACKLNIAANAKIEKIFGELKTLQLSKHRHAIGVLMRVFLEMSIDHYLVETAGSSLTFTKGGHINFKKLEFKVKETIEHMVANGATEKDFKGVTAGMTDEHHPFSIDTLHAYIHNRFFTPTESNLTTGWDNAQRFFETIWK